MSIFQMAATHRKSTSSFRFGDVPHLRTSKSICILNFNNVTQSAAEILLFPVSGTNGRHVKTLLSVSILTLSSSSACDSVLARKISSTSGHRQQSHGIIAIFKVAATALQIYFRFHLGDALTLLVGSHDP